MTQYPDTTRAFLAFRDHGDPAGITQVFDATSEELRRVAAHLVGDRATADDLVQSTFLAAIEVASTFDADQQVVPWLIGILRNQALMVQRRQRRRPDPQRLQAAMPDSSDPVRSAEDREFDALVDEALQQLPAAYRPVLELHLKHGLIANEIASALDRPAGTVRTQIVRGLERLRDLLPVGLGCLIAGLLPSTGMAAVREAVRKAGTRKLSGTGAVPTAAKTTVITGTLIGGSLVMKKAVLAAAVVLVLLVTAWSLNLLDGSVGRSVDGPIDTRRTVVATDPDEGSSALPSDPPAISTGVAERAPIATRSAEEERGVVLRGVVRGPEGNPIAAAKVFSGTRKLSGEEWTDDDPAAVTDEAGRFELQISGKSFNLVAVRGDLMSKLIIEGQVQTRDLIEGLVLDLAETAIAEGVVLDSESQPIAGHPVHSYFTYGLGSHSQTKVAGVRASSAIRHEIVTDANGRFRVRVIAGLNYGWEVQHPKHPMLRECFKAAQSPFELRLDPGAVVSGRVFRVDGAPAVGALVVIDDHPRREARCAADGSFTLTGVGIPEKPTPSGVSRSIGNRNVHEIRSPYLRIVDPASAIYIHVLETAKMNGTLTDLDIHLERPLALAGRVLGVDGHPIVGAEVKIIGDREFEPGFGHSEKSTWEWAHDCNEMQTGADGAFRFERLYQGEFELRVTIEGGDAVPIRRQVVAGAEAIVIRVDPNERRGVVLAGSVRDALTGEALDEFTIVPWFDGVNSVSNVTCKSEGGRFESKALEPGRIRFTFVAEGYAPRNLEWQDYAQGVHEVSIDLAPVRGLEVRVVDAKGRDAQRFNVRGLDATGIKLVFDVGGGSSQSEIRAYKGVALLRGMPAERVTLLVEVPGMPVVRKVLDLIEPMLDPVTVTCGGSADPVYAEVIVFCAEKGADLSEIEALFTKQDRQSFGRLLMQVLERKDVWLPEVSLEFSLESSKAGVRPSAATLTYKGEKKEVRPGLTVPVYDKTERRYDGTGYGSDTAEIPAASIGHLRQDLLLKVRAKGFTGFDQKIPADAFRAGGQLSVPGHQEVRLLVILRRE